MGQQSYLSSIRTKGPVIIYRLKGGGWAAEDSGLNSVKFSRSPLCLNVTSLKWSPLKTFDDFRVPPTRFVFVFLANLSGPLSDILPKFSVIPPFGFSVTTDPAFRSPIKRIRPNRAGIPLDKSTWKWHRNLEHYQTKTERHRITKMVKWRKQWRKKWRQPKEQTKNLQKI